MLQESPYIKDVAGGIDAPKFLLMSQIITTIIFSLLVPQTIYFIDTDIENKRVNKSICTINKCQDGNIFQYFVGPFLCS